MRNTLAVLCFILSIAGELLAANNSLADLPKKAIDQSQITLPGSRPFHLRANVVEMTNPDNKGFEAEIEEFWVAPDKWRRIVKSADFSETLVVNGEKTREEISGEYYPNWLRTIVNAIFDPGAQIAGIDLTRSSDNPVIGGTKTCRRFSSPVGISPVTNRVFHSFCFDNGLLESVLRPGYRAEYLDYKKFADKKVARRVQEWLEQGTTLQAKIEELNELSPVSDDMFGVVQPTDILETVAITEQAVRGLVTASPAMQWSSVRGGKTTGVLSVYVCIDRAGHVREAYALNSDHPVMSDDAQRQLLKWHFKPAKLKGMPVQVEGILTFAYETKLDPQNGK
jgi:hypothetical protein